MDSGLGNFRINRYSGTNEKTNFHEFSNQDLGISDDGGGGIGGAGSFGRNVSTCFGGRVLNSNSAKKPSMGRGFTNPRAQTHDDGYFTVTNEVGPAFGNQRSGYFSSASSGSSPVSPFGNISGLSGMGRGRSSIPSLLGDSGPSISSSGYNDSSGFSSRGRIGGGGGGGIGGCVSFGMNTDSAIQRNFFDNPTPQGHSQEYTSAVRRDNLDLDSSGYSGYQDEDLEPPARHHSMTYPSVQSRGPVFRRGGLRGGRMGQGIRSGVGGSRFPNKSGGGDRDRSNRDQPNKRHSEPLLPRPTSTSPHKAISGKSVPSKIGVHLDITPPIFKEMSNRGLGDKVFIMIPKQAKSVMDVKIHVAGLLGLDVYLVNFFINGFRFPENEDVEAFACISKNSLVQVVKPGYRPPCDLSMLNKSTEEKSAPPSVASSSSIEEVEVQPKGKVTDSELEPEHDHAAVVAAGSKRRPNYMEPSLLGPSPRRSRYSNTSQQDKSSPNVTTLTPIIKLNTSPTKSIIEIVLSDDEEEEVNTADKTKTVKVPEDKEKPGDCEIPSSSSSPGKLVIEEGEENQEQKEQKRAEGNKTETGGNDGKLQGQRQEFTVEDEVGNSPENEPASVPHQSQAQAEAETADLGSSVINPHANTQTKSCDQQEQQSDNWLNAAGQVVGRGRKRPENEQEHELVELSSPERDDEDDDDDAGTSTTFEDDSNDADKFFTPAIVAVHSIPIGVFNKIEEEAAAVAAKLKQNDCQRLGNENWDAASLPQSDIQIVSTSSVSAASTLPNPCASPSSSSGSQQQSQTSNTEAGQASEESKQRKTVSIDEINQIKCGSLILYQMMEESNAGQGAGDGGDRQLSEMKCCKVIGRNGLKLTLEPVQYSEAEGISKTESVESDLSTKLVFVDFKDMINLQEVVEG